MAENNNDNFKIAEISNVILGSLKNNYFVLKNNYVVLKLKNNDFAIYYDTGSNITISLGKQKQLLSTINNKLSEKEFVVKQNDKNENELYFVFFTKDLVGQSNDDFVADVLLLPSDKILKILSYKNRTQDIPQQLAASIRNHIVANRDMNWQQKIFDLYNGKNNENNIINQENNEDNNKNNINNVKEEEEEIKNENNNIEEKENNNSINNNIVNQENNERNNLNDNIGPNNKHKNTVSLFGLNGCYKITKEEQSNHSCGCCFW